MFKNTRTMRRGEIRKSFWLEKNLRISAFSYSEKFTEFLHVPNLQKLRRFWHVFSHLQEFPHPSLR